MAVRVALFAMPAGLAAAGAQHQPLAVLARRRREPVGEARRSGRSASPASRPSSCCFRCLCCPRRRLRSTRARRTSPTCLPTTPPARATRRSSASAAPAGPRPFEVTFHTDGPITTTKRLRALKRFQERVARLEGVDAVLGPAALLERTAVLRRLTRQIASGGAQLTRLERGLAPGHAWHRAAAQRPR